MDDMIVRTKEDTDHMAYLRKVSEEVRKHNTRLNPEKCTFGVRAGKFLGFYLTEQGINANLVKCKAIVETRHPTTEKDVQKLTGMIAALSRVVFEATKQSLPFFKLLKKGIEFEWNEECEHTHSLN